MPPTETDRPDPDAQPVYRREDDPDPAVRAGGPFPTEDSGEGAAWAKAFGDAEEDAEPKENTAVG